MSEVLLPPWIVPEVETHDWLDEGSAVFGAAFAPGIAQRQSYGGLRLKMSRRHTVRGEEKAQLLAVLNQTRGRFNALRTKVHFALRGSGFGGELLTNNTFANGTTGWNSNSSSDLSVADRIMRVTREGTAAITGLFTSSAASVTQYAPIVVRGALGSIYGAQNSFALLAGSTGGGNDYLSGSTITATGLYREQFTAPAATAFISLYDLETSGTVAGNYMDIPYMSASRGALVDNGLNLLLQSDELDTTWTATRASVDDQATTAPDGTATADSIIEDATASNTHQVSQAVTVSSAAGDYALSVALKAGARTWAHIALSHATGASTAWVNLSTGAIGTVSNGTDWTNARGFVTAMGNGWYVLSLVARKTSAATSVTAIIRPTTADNVQSYSGDGTSNIYAWRATLVQSGIPTRLIQTTTTASTGTSQTGNALHVKGLPASTNGLLLPGDYFEINGEIKQCTAALNSDATGLGYLQFESALVRSPANEDPIIVIDPMGKFLVSNIRVDNRFGTDAVVTYDLELIYE